MKAHICGTASRDVSETREQRLKRLEIARGIKKARKESNKKEPESVESKNASMLDSVKADSRDFHSL